MREIPWTICIYIYRERSMWKFCLFCLRTALAYCVPVFRSAGRFVRVPSAHSLSVSRTVCEGAFSTQSFGQQHGLWGCLQHTVFRSAARFVRVPSAHSLSVSSTVCAHSLSVSSKVSKYSTSTEAGGLSSPFLTGPTVCSPKTLRTVGRTIIRFLIELLDRRIWFG